MKPIFTILILLCASIVYASEPCELVRVIDGDTVVVLLKSVETKIRLNEIDAPELRQPYGEEAKQTLEKYLDRKTLTIDVLRTDVYGRTLARIYADGKDVGLRMVQAGAAWPYKNQAPDKFYRYTMYSMWNHRGLWKDENPVPPWEWRKENRK